MKKVFLNILVLALLCLNIPAAQAINLPATPKDTVTIQIGKGKKIIIWVDSKEDLKELQAYDINKMIRELGETVDSLDNAERVLIITNENGKEYKVEIEEEESEVAEDWYKHEKDTSPAPASDSTKIKKKIEYNIEFNKDDKDKDKKYHNRPFRTRHSIDFDLGMNNYVTPAGEIPSNEQYSVRPWGSWYVGINSNFRTRIAGPLALQWGAGVDWYNFKFEDDRTRLDHTPTGVEFYQLPSSEVRAIKSKLTASYVNVNVVPMLDFRYKSKLVRESDGTTKRIKNYKSDAFRIGLGGYAGYRIGSYAKYKFDDGDTRKAKDRENFHLNNWRYGMRLQLGFKGVDLFANYDLNELFSTGRGPQLQGLSFGLTL